MKNENVYKYWLAVEDSKIVRFSDLAHMIAKALHPGDDKLFSYDAARINLEVKLNQAVADGILRVFNPATLGRHTFPVDDDALQRAVLIPNKDGLEPFLNAQGIELRITPFGNGPLYWTIKNAATAMQEQEGWHDGMRAEFQDDLQNSALNGSLVVLNPLTCLPINPERVRIHILLVYVTPANMNAWLGKQAAPYRWKLQSTVTQPQAAPEGAGDSAKQHSNKSEKTLIFEAKVLELMGKFWNDKTPGTKPTKGDLSKKVYDEMLRGTIRGQRTLTYGMVRDAAKPWKTPLGLPTFVPDSKFNDKRHPFKGEK